MKIQTEASINIPIQVTERLGIERIHEAVLNGIPLPRSAQIYSTDGLSIIDSATTNIIDSDYIVTARWGGSPTNTSKPIKWLLSSFKASVPANGVKNYAVIDYRAATNSFAITCAQGSIWTVNTGVAEFEISTNSFNLFHRVKVNGKEIVSPAGNAGPYYSLTGTNYYAQSSGGCCVTLFRQSENNQTLTLKIKGSHRTVSSSTDEDFEFNTFLTFFADSSQVIAHHTVQNNRTWEPLENNADFRTVGSPNSMYADEIGLRLHLNSATSQTFSTSSGTNTTTGPLADTLSIYQDSSGDSTWDQWATMRNTGAGNVDFPTYTPAAYVTFQGYEVKDGAAVIESGNKMTGFLDVSGTNGGVTVAVQDFWQNFPKALRAHPSGQIDVALFPEEFRARHVLRVGEQKTHKILFYFHGPEATDVANVGAGFDKPLIALADPSWYAEITRVIPTVSTEAPEPYRFQTFIPSTGDSCGKIVTNSPAEYDRFMRRHIYGPGAGGSCSDTTNGYAFNGLNEAVPAAQLYSWMDYGDIPIDFEQQYDNGTNVCAGWEKSITGQYGWKYDGDYGLWMNALRTLDDGSDGDGEDYRLRFLDYALAASRHTVDIDMMHHGSQSGRGISDFRDGGMFGHSQHNSDGIQNPHRNGDYGTNACYNGGNFNGTPTSDMLFGVGALALGYWVTGEPQFAEGLNDIGAWTKFWIEQVNTDGRDTGGRAAANEVNACTWAYQFTGDTNYLRDAIKVVTNSPPMFNPLSDRFTTGLSGDALGRLVDALHENNDSSLDAYLAAVAQTTVDPQNTTWDFVYGDACAWAALLLPNGRSNFMTLADTFFESGIYNPASWNRPGYSILRVWQIKEWVNELRMGHPYQLALYDFLGGPKFSPANAIAPTGGAAIQNTTPNAIITGAINGDTDNPISFSAAGSSDTETSPEQLRYFWDFGDGQSATGSNVTHQYQYGGNFAVHLWVSDGEAVDLAIATSVVTFINHAPLANAGTDRMAPTNVAVYFNGSASTDQPYQSLSYTWNFGDGQSSSSVTASHAYQSIGIYTAVLTVSDGELSDQDDLIITVKNTSTQTYASVYTNSSDTYIWANSRDLNYDGGQSFYIGRQNYTELEGLMSFGLATIPEGSLITSAKLEYYVSTTSGPANNVKIFPISTPWIVNKAAWDYFDGNYVWKSGGGADYDSTLMTSRTLQAGVINTADVTSIVQSWFVGRPNYGFVFHPDETVNYWSALIAAKENSTAALRPALRITYTPLEGVEASNIPPAIVTQPASTSILYGETATLNVQATGSSPLNYQWYQGTQLVGSNSASFTTPPLYATTSFWVRVTNTVGSVDSSPATVTVTFPPDTNAPATTILSPANGSWLIGSTSIVANCSDDVGLLSGQLFMDGEGVGQAQTLSGISTAVSFSLNTILYSNGSHSLFVRARDVGSNTTDSAAIIVNITNSVSLVVKTFQNGVNGYTGTEDTFIRFGGGFMDCNYGGDGQLLLFQDFETFPRGESLIKFDTDQIPLGSQIQSATLELIPTSISDSSTHSARVHRVTTSWIEGIYGAYCPIPNIGATWNTYDGTNAWPGGVGATYEDYGIMSASISMNQTVELDVTEIVQDWSYGAENYGFVVVPGSINNQWYGYLHSSESSTITSRPKLTVVYYETSDSNQPPTILTHPAASSVVAGQFASLSVLAIGSAPLNYQWYQGISGDLSQPVGLNSSTFTTPILLATTSYWVRITNAVGVTNSQTANITVTLVPDLSPPAASIVSPTNGSLVFGTINISASLSDDLSLDRAQLTIDFLNFGAEQIISGTSTNISYSWNTRSYNNGSHSLRIMARDVAGNITTSTPVNITVSNTPITGQIIQGVRIGNCESCLTGSFVSVRVDAANPAQTGVSELRHNLGVSSWILERFDLSTLPTNTLIRRARVCNFYETGVGGWLWEQIVKIYPIIDPSGLGAWNSSSVSFNKRSGSQAWTSSGGTLTNSLGSLLLDRYYEPWANFSQGTVTPDGWDITDLAQQWITDPNSNHGLAIQGVAVTYGSPGYLHSSTMTNLDSRPFLEIEYYTTNAPDTSPEQITGLNVTHDGAGRTFVTWNEKTDTNNFAYRIYRHNTPISQSNLASAALIGEVEKNGTAKARIRTMAESYVLPPATVGQFYSITFTATGSVASAVTNWDADNLPPGLSLNGSGTLSGTPTVPGNWQMTINPQNNAGAPVDFSAGLSVKSDAETIPSSNISIQPNPYQSFYVQFPSGTRERYWAARDSDGELAPGSGLFVYSPTNAGSWYYAMTYALNGQENSISFSEENSLQDSVTEVVGDGLPVLQWGPFYYYSSTETAWIYAFWPGHNKFHNDEQFATPFRLTTPTPLNTGVPHAVQFTYGGYSTTYMLPTYSSLDSIPQVVISLESRTPYFENYNGHALTDWFIGYRNNLGKVELGRPSAGTFHYYGIERSRFIADWLQKGSGHAAFNINTNILVAWGGSQGGTAILFTSLHAPDMFVAAHANIPCMNWYTEYDYQQWTSNTFIFLAGRDVDNVHDVQGRPTTNGLNSVKMLQEVIDSGTNVFPTLTFMVGWNDTTLAWDQDNVDFIQTTRISDLPITYSWGPIGHNGSFSGLFGFVTNNRPVIGYANCSLYSSDIPPYNAYQLYSSDTNNFWNWGAIHGNPKSYTSGYYTNHIQADLNGIQESINDFKVTIYADNSYVSTTGTVDITPRRMTSFKPSAGSTLVWSNQQANQSGIITVDANGLWTIPEFKFTSSGNTLYVNAASPALTFQAWLLLYFAPGELSTIGAPTADPDEDGLKNLMEYALNTSPLVAETQSPFVTSLNKLAGDTQSYLYVSYLRRKPPTDLSYYVERATNLISTSWQSGVPYTEDISTAENIDGVTQTVLTRIYPAGNTNTPIFVRLRVTNP